MTTAIIFRKRLLAYTETFIAEQAHHLPTWEPIFAGFKKDSAGFNLIKSKALPKKNYSISLESDYSPFPTFTAGLHKKFGFINRRWAAALSTKNPAIIHAHFGSEGMSCIPLAKHLNIPLVTTFHGNDITQNTPMNHYRKNRHIVFEKSDKIIAVSEFIKGQLIKKGCPEEKIIQHYIGVDVQKFRPTTTPAISGRVIFVGRLIEKKGAKYLIRAIQDAATSNPDIHLRIIGDGPLRAQLEKESLLRPCNVEFLGRLSPDDVAEHIKTAQLLCAPSVTSERGDQEGLPISILEAIASGVPVISTYSAGIAEALEHKVNGFLTQEKDVAALSTHIQAICSNPALRESLAKKARNTAIEKFSLDLQCERLEDIYMSASEKYSSIRR